MEPNNSYFEVQIVVDGQTLPYYQKDGRFFVASETDRHYIIRVRNKRNSRVEFVESVDSRNVLQDEAASYDNRGMIVSAYRTWDNHGWRINDDTTRDFVFTDPAASIAAQATGSVAQVGVIGVAVFLEKVYVPEITWKYTSIVSSFDVSKSGAVTDYAAAEDDVPRGISAPLHGTGMGEQRESHVRHTSFERDSRFPIAMVEIQYRPMQWLVEHHIVDSAYPSAFPKASPPDDTGYGKYAK